MRGRTAKRSMGQRPTVRGRTAGSVVGPRAVPVSPSRPRHRRPVQPPRPARPTCRSMTPSPTRPASAGRSPPSRRRPLRSPRVPIPRPSRVISRLAAPSRTSARPPTSRRAPHIRAGPAARPRPAPRELRAPQRADRYRRTEATVGHPGRDRRGRGRRVTAGRGGLADDRFARAGGVAVDLRHLAGADRAGRRPVGAARTAVRGRAAARCEAVSGRAVTLGGRRGRARRCQPDTGVRRDLDRPTAAPNASADPSDDDGYIKGVPKPKPWDLVGWFYVLFVLKD